MELLDAIDANDKDRVLQLINENIDLNYINNIGESSVYKAVKSPEILRILLNAGSNPNHGNIFGLTALHISTNTEVIKILIKSGTDVNIQDCNYTIPIQWKHKQTDINILLNNNSFTDKNITCKSSYYEIN